MSAEVVSASWPKAAHACLTSCSGTHSVERLERSGKEEREAHAGVSCCSCDDRGSTVVIGGPFLLVEENICSTCDRSARPVKMKSAELVTEKGQTVKGMPVLMLTRGITDRHSLGTLLLVEQQPSPPLSFASA